MGELLIGPDEDQKRRIRDELGENEDRMKNNIRLIKEWIRCTTYMPEVYGECSYFFFLN